MKFFFGGVRDAVKGEPVVAGVVARLIVALVGRYGIQLDADQLVALMVAIEPIIGALTRRHTSPAKP